MNFKLYHSINVKYPPILDPRLEALAAGMLCFYGQYNFQALFILCIFFIYFFDCYIITCTVHDFFLLTSMVVFHKEKLSGNFHCI